MFGQFVHTKDEPKLVLLTHMQPVLYFTPQALVKMRTYMEEAGTNEVGWLGDVRLENGRYICKEIYLPKQEVHGATTEILPEGLVALAEANPEVCEHLRLWGHSHVNMGVSPSGQDQQQMELFVKNGLPWFYRLITNKRGEMGLTFFNFEGGYQVNDCKWDVEYPLDFTELIAACKQEVADMVRPFRTSYNNWGWGPSQYQGSSYGGRLWEEAESYGGDAGFAGPASVAGARNTQSQADLYSTVAAGPNVIPIGNRAETGGVSTSTGGTDAGTGSLTFGKEANTEGVNGPTGSLATLLKLALLPEYGLLKDYIEDATHYAACDVYEVVQTTSLELKQTGQAPVRISENVYLPRAEATKLADVILKDVKLPYMSILAAVDNALYEKDYTGMVRVADYLCERAKTYCSRYALNRSLELLHEEVYRELSSSIPELEALIEACQQQSTSQEDTKEALAEEFNQLEEMYQAKMEMEV